MTFVLPRSNPAEGATYSDFCALLEALWQQQLQEPTYIEINPVDEYQVNGWAITPAMTGMTLEKLKQEKVQLKAFVNPFTGHEIPLILNEHVAPGVMRFLGASDEDLLALLGLYPLAGEALADQH